MGFFSGGDIRKKIRGRAVSRACVLVAVLAIAAAGGACGRKPKLPTPAPPKPASGSFEEGLASWYGHPYHGRRTANGEVYDMNTSTAAHRTLPFDTWVRVVNLDNSRSCTVRINDRGPFVEGRIIDLSRKAAEEIRMIGPGVAPVRVYIVDGPAARSSSLFTVQVGAFRESGNAKRLRDRLQANFKDVFIEKAGDIHRVRVGRLGDIQQAYRLAEQLRKDRDVQDAVVVRLD